MSEKNKSCKDCKFATWERTATGRIKTRTYGECTVEFPKPVLPACISTPHLHKVVIWCDQKHDCPYFEPVEKPKKPKYQYPKHDSELKRVLADLGSSILAIDNGE